MKFKLTSRFIEGQLLCVLPSLCFYWVWCEMWAFWDWQWPPEPQSHMHLANTIHIVTYCLIVIIYSTLFFLLQKSGHRPSTTYYICETVHIRANRCMVYQRNTIKYKSLYNFQINSAQHVRELALILYSLHFCLNK